MISRNETETVVKEQSHTYRVKVLLVDDNPANLVSLESILKNEEEDIDYIHASSGEMALKIALKEDLALILLDVQMPGMNGFEVAEFLRQNSRTKVIPIIFVTAINQELAHMEEGFEVGGVDFLFKPLHPFITKAKVAAFINFYIQRKEVEKINFDLEERVRERTKELIRINNDLDNFIYTASHDLKAPISNIEGLMNSFYDAMSEETKKSKEIQEIKNLIDVSIERFKNTIVDLTEVAKAQSEEASDSASVDVQELVEEVKLSIKDLIESSDAVITEYYDVEAIYFSRKNLRSIFYNLLSNAVKYSSPQRQPAISISVLQDDRSIIVSVKDNGLGIPVKDHEKVFGMFKRLHSHVEGTGIGMAIVKKIVENSGGKIELESEVNVGSTFRIYLPK